MQGFPSRSPSPRTTRLRRGLSAFALALCALFFASPAARAQDAGVSTGSVSFSADDFFIAFYGADANSAALSTLQIQQFFNQANCLCGNTIRLNVKFTASGAAKAQQLMANKPSTAPMSPVMFTLGDACNSTLSSAGFSACKSDNGILRQEQLNVFRQNGITIGDWTAADFSQHYGATAGTGATDGGTTDGSVCSKTSFTQNLWVLLSTDNNGTFDQYITYPIPIDLQPPAVPGNIKLARGNEALTLTWTGLDSLSQSDVLGYQVLCSRDDQDPVFPGSYKPAYASVATLKDAGAKCPGAVSASSGSFLVDKDPRFVCSGLLPTASSAYRLKILENGIYYGATVVAIDRALNASAVTEDDIWYDYPEPSNDFFYYYKGYGQAGPPGDAKGGFCNVAPPGDNHWLYGGGTLVAFSLVVLSRRRRR